MSITRVTMFLLLSCLIAHTQTLQPSYEQSTQTEQSYRVQFPRTETFGGYSYLHVGVGSDSVDTGTSGNVPAGWVASTTINANRYVGVESQFGGHYKSVSGAHASIHTFLFGPRLTYRTRKVTPFVHALFGATRGDANVEGFGGGGASAFSMAFGGGLDYNVNRAVAVRIGQFDYLLLNAPGFTDIGGLPKVYVGWPTLSAGIVFKLGHVGATAAVSSRPMTGVTATQGAGTVGVQSPIAGNAALKLLGISAESNSVYGLRVLAVTPDSPAARSGFAANDYIVAANGRPVRTADDLAAALFNGSDRATVVVNRPEWLSNQSVSREVILK